MQRKVSVVAQNDHIQQLTTGSPITALSELVWNALDADATEVRVSIIENKMGGVFEVSVEDNGTGIRPSTVERSFGHLGGSWKKDSRLTPGRRIVHGRDGKGRFKAFAIGSFVQWESLQTANGTHKKITIAEHKHKLRDLDVSTEDIQNEVANKQGTIVRIQNILENVSLDADKLLLDLAKNFALYLQSYPNVRIFVQDTLIDPKEIQRGFSRCVIAPTNELSMRAELKIIEWKTSADRTIVLCDEDGVGLEEETVKVQTPGFKFTAYLCSEYFRKLLESGALDMRELEPEFAKLIELARDTIRTHFRQKAANQAQESVKRWKEEGIYPFEEKTEPGLETARREVFDIVALEVTSKLPDFEKSSVLNRRFAFRLLRQAVEQNSASLQKIMKEVLGLAPEKMDELAELLDRTSLGSIISTAKLITDRLEFLTGIKDLVFGKETKKTLKERKHLHRLLAENTWLFNEQYAVTVDDQSLNELLRQYRKEVGLSDPTDPVTLIDGGTGIIDLVLSRSIPQPNDEEREFLVIELKRPSVKVDGKVITQIKDYAYAIMKDDRFRGTKTRWVFWAVSNEICDRVNFEATQNNREPGLVLDREDVQLWAQTWSQVFRRVEARLNYLKKQIDAQITTQSAQDHLKKYYSKYLPSNVGPGASDEAQVSTNPD